MGEDDERGGFQMSYGEQEVEEMVREAETRDREKEDERDIAKNKKI